MDRSNKGYPWRAGSWKNFASLSCAECRRSIGEAGWAGPLAMLRMWLAMAFLLPFFLLDMPPRK